MKFRKKPVVVEAYRWVNGVDSNVTYYQDAVGVDRACAQCANRMNIHGWIDTLEGGYRVCPGDWIIKGVAGEMYPRKPDIFEATYERVE